MKYKLDPWESTAVSRELYKRGYSYQAPEVTPTYEKHLEMLEFINSAISRGEKLDHGHRLCDKLYGEAQQSLLQDRKIYLMYYDKDVYSATTPTFEEFMSILNKVQFYGNIEQLNCKEIDILNICLVEKHHDILTEEEHTKRKKDMEKFIASHPELIKGIIQPEIQQESASATSIESVIQDLECAVGPENDIESAQSLDGAHGKPIGETDASSD